jgi:hypothetical protein
LQFGDGQPPNRRCRTYCPSQIGLFGERDNIDGLPRIFANVGFRIAGKRQPMTEIRRILLKNSLLQ